MRFFELLNFQHVLMAFFPTLIFVVLLGLGLGFHHFVSESSEHRKKHIVERFPEGIEERQAPFPLIMLLTIIGTVLWAFFYILGIGLFKVVI